MWTLKTHTIWTSCARLLEQQWSFVLDPFEVNLSTIWTRALWIYWVTPLWSDILSVLLWPMLCTLPSDVRYRQNPVRYTTSSRSYIDRISSPKTTYLPLWPDRESVISMMTTNLWNALNGQSGTLNIVLLATITKHLRSEIDFIYLIGNEITRHYVLLICTFTAIIKWGEYTRMWTYCQWWDRLYCTGRVLSYHRCQISLHKVTWQSTG